MDDRCHLSTGSVLGWLADDKIRAHPPAAWWNGFLKIEHNPDTNY